MKVVLINTLYDPHLLGGAERSVQFLAESLAKHGHVPVVISTNPNPGVREDRLNGVKLYYVAVKNLYSPFKKRDTFHPLRPFWHVIDTYNPLMARAIGDILDREAPDIVHTNNLAGFSVSVWAAAQRRKLPIIHTLRDYYLLCPRSTMFHKDRNCTTQCWYCRVYSIVRKLMSRYVDAVVGNSQFILNRHIHHGCFERTKVRKVIFSAYAAQSMPPPARTVNGDALRLGFLGRLKPNKGITPLLDAVARLPGRDYQLWIGGWDEGHLGGSYGMENVFFLGFVDPELFFQHIDVLVVPSLWHDPLPRTIFEAYTHGVPVIASNRGGIPEIVDVGETGFLFNPERPDTLISVLTGIKEDPHLLHRMRAGALKKSAEFSPENSLMHYISLYRDTMVSREDHGVAPV